MNNQQLSFLSDEKLLNQTKFLVQKERDINFQVLRHLEEIELRKLYLSRGFSSLFEYAIKELGYSGSAAQRRIKAMKLCKDIPEVETKLKSGKLNLTTALQLQHFFEKTQAKTKEKSKYKNQAHFTFKSVDKCTKTNEKEERGFNDHTQTMDCSENFQETKNVKQTECPKEIQKTILNKTQKINLMEKIEGKSSREVEKILTQLTGKEIFLKDKIKYINPNKIKMNIIVQEKCLVNLEKLKHLLSHQNPNMNYGDLLLTLSEIALEKYDPTRRYERRLYKKENHLKKKSKNMLTSVYGNTENENNNFQKRKSLKMGRYIPSRVRDYVWSRDEGRCTYVCSKTNKKCHSKYLLQIDHIQPFSLGGSHSSKNLRLLCAFHNQYRNRMNDNKKLGLRGCK